MAELCQQSALYRAEVGVNHGRRFSEVEEAQEFIDRLMDHQWWEDEYPQVVRVEVRFIPGLDSVGAWEPDHRGGVMEMAKDHRCELYLLHELAHVLADSRYGRCSHNPWFARTYLTLVYRVMGSD